MHEGLRRKLEMLARVREFGITNAALFPPGSRGAQLLATLGEVLTKLQQLAGSQASSRTTGRNVTTSKSVARAAVIDDLDAISLNARALAVTTPGLEDKFRLPRNAGDQVLLASARAFAADALPLKDQFIALEMPANFLEDLQADIAELESALTQRRKIRSSQVNATASMDATLAEGIEIVQQLKAVMHNKLSGDDCLMTAWLRASRTERSRGRSTLAPGMTEPKPGGGASAASPVASQAQPQSASPGTSATGEQEPGDQSTPRPPGNPKA